MSYRVLAPIERYWTLMKEDNPDEAMSVLLANEGDPACLFERAMSVRGFEETVSLVMYHQYLRKSADLGYALAQVMQAMPLEGAPVDVACLRRVTSSSSLSSAARALAMSFLRETEEGNDHDGDEAEVAQEIVDHWTRALMPETLETPRVYALFYTWAKTFGKDAAFHNMDDPELVIKLGAEAGIPELQILRAVDLIQKHDSARNIGAAVDLLQRKTVCLLGEARQWWLALAFYIPDTPFCDWARAARHLLAIDPHATQPGRNDAFCRRLFLPSRVANQRIDDRLREKCIFGRALKRGEVGRPPCPEGFDVNDVWVSLISMPQNDADRPGFFAWLEWQQLVESNGVDLTTADGEIREWIALYDRWIGTVQVAIIEFFKCMKRYRPRLDPNVAQRIGRLVWQAREQDAPIWISPERAEELPRKRGIIRTNEIFPC